MIGLLLVFFVLFLFLAAWTWYPTTTSTCSAAVKAPQKSMARSLESKGSEGAVLSVLMPLPPFEQQQKKKITSIETNPIISVLREAFRHPFRSYDVIVVHGGQPEGFKSTVILAQALATADTVLIMTHCDPEHADWKALVAENLVVWDPENVFTDDKTGAWMKAAFVPERLSQCASSYLPALTGVNSYVASLAREKELRSQFRQVRTFLVQTEMDIVEACVLKAMYPTMNVTLGTELETQFPVGVEFLKKNILI
jgi:hypothetical protein